MDRYLLTSWITPWRKRPPWVEIVTRLVCILIALLAAAALICDHFGLDRTGRKLARVGLAEDADLDRLQTAIELCDEQLLHQALRRSPDLDLDREDGHGRTPLSRAARNGWLFGCRVLLERGAEVDRPDGFESAPIVYAAGCALRPESADVVDLLIARGAEVNEGGYAGTTPLIHAASCGALEPARRLIRAGADVNAKPRSGYTALHCAVDGDEPEMIHLLLAAGADPAAVDDAGQTPLDLARARGELATARLLETALQDRAAPPALRFTRARFWAPALPDAATPPRPDERLNRRRRG